MTSLDGRAVYHEGPEGNVDTSADLSVLIFGICTHFNEGGLSDLFRDDELLGNVLDKPEGDEVGSRKEDEQAEEDDGDDIAMLSQPL